jgi:ABC-type Na+ efflux pump permease subunit
MTHMPPMPATPPTPPAKPKRTLSNGIVIGAAAAVIAAVIGTGIFVVQATNGDDRPASTSSSSRATEESEPVVEDDVEEPDLDLYVTDPTADDFAIELRTKSKQCFGSAGCNLVVEPELTYNGDTTELDPDLTYEITYEISGDESGPILQTAEVTDQTTATFDTTMVSTPSRGTELSVEVMDVTTSEW